MENKKREIKFKAYGERGTKGKLFMNWKGGISELLDMGQLLDGEKGKEFFERNIFCQFTGLKDKNGKEIYEKDIVKIGKRNYEIIYGEYKAGFIIKKFLYDGRLPFELEVVGNICENPKPLK